MITRSAVIADAVRTLLRTTRTSMGSYAQTVADIYLLRTPEPMRVVRFHTGPDAYRAMRANEQIVRRWLDDDASARLPADAEEACVLAMPQPLRDEVLGVLAGRYGLLAARAPQADCRDDARGLAALFTATGQAGEQVARMLANNGRIGPEDRPYARDALTALRRTQAEAATLIERIEHEIGPELRVVGEAS